MVYMRVLLAASLLLAPAASASDRLGRCGFDATSLSFDGSPVEQARCLLSPVLKAGKVGQAPARLGDVLETRIGKPVTADRAALKRLLKAEGLSSLAAGLDRPVSKSENGTRARYFVIHDTSQKLPGDKFPPDGDPRLNGLGFKKKGAWVAHAFLNRRGEVLLAHDFSVPWRATQLEMKAGTVTRGIFLHVEHNQPRLRDPVVKADNDRIAPTPGFTDQQYDRSALLYIVASIRAGTWLIPAYHAVMDTGVVKGGHDDPQNWNRDAFEAAFSRRLTDLGAG